MKIALNLIHSLLHFSINVAKAFNKKHKNPIVILTTLIIGEILNKLGPHTRE